MSVLILKSHVQESGILYLHTKMTENCSGNPSSAKNDVGRENIVVTYCKVNTDDEEVGWNSIVSTAGEIG